jgi:2-polyprenyl-3-methyl-5-hydroxy-6-metoxy-1,4-benzoquinol methylase
VNDSLSHVDVINAMYAGILERSPDEGGSEHHLNLLKNGTQLADLIRYMIASEEFKSKNASASLNKIILPDLTALYPEKYSQKAGDFSIFNAHSDEEFRFIESMIVKHRYYDAPGVWSPEINLDKHVTAAIVRSLGAKSCIELGCSGGPVLSLLSDKGVDVCGVEVSHLAFLQAYANIHDKMRYGTLLNLDFDTSYDVFLAMDVFEHLNPLDLNKYIERAKKLVKHDGFVFLNSPMFGTDDMFGSPFGVHLKEWQEAGENDYWSDLHCDARGWPMHGHLVWASPKWWENLFLQHGLVRDRGIEKVMHEVLGTFFDKVGPARRSFFILRRHDFMPDLNTISQNIRSMVAPVVTNI